MLQCGPYSGRLQTRRSSDQIMKDLLWRIEPSSGHMVPHRRQSSSWSARTTGEGQRCENVTTEARIMFTLSELLRRSGGSLQDVPVIFVDQEIEAGRDTKIEVLDLVEVCSGMLCTSVSHCSCKAIFDLPRGGEPCNIRSQENSPWLEWSATHLNTIPWEFCTISSCRYRR